jgi:hypothetical protein
MADSLSNSNKIIVAAFFSPNPFSTNVLNRSIYKVGFNYGTDPITLQNKQFKAYGVSAGISLPFQFKAEENRPMLMLLHLNIEAGNKTNDISALPTENYFKLFAGISVSGNWFQKRKFD